MCVVVLAEAAKSSADAVSDKASGLSGGVSDGVSAARDTAADAVSDTASDLLGGVSDGVSAARDTAQQLLDSANSATGDLQAAASDIQSSVSWSLSSAFDALQTATSSAVGAPGKPCFAAHPASKGGPQPDAKSVREQVHCQSLCTRCCQWSAIRPCPRHSKQQTVPCSSDSFNDVWLATFAHMRRTWVSHIRRHEGLHEETSQPGCAQAVIQVSNAQQASGKQWDTGVHLC